MVQHVDVVFASSVAQFERRKPLNPHTYLIRNGCDFEYIQSQLAVDRVPEELQDLKRPIIGCVGVYDFKVDIELFVQLARSRPAWNFVLVGPWLRSTEELKQLQALHNVMVIGRRPFEHIPVFLKQFDIGIIPWHITDSIANAFPLKLFEYLAAGLPVVSTKWPELARMEDVGIRFANDATGFVEAIEEELAHDTEAKRRERMAIARNNSWSAKADEVWDIVSERLAEKMHTAKGR